MVGLEIGYGIGTVGLVLTFAQQWVNRREPTNSPCGHLPRGRGRHFAEHSDQAVSVYLTNESAASAFNIRFGVSLAGAPVGWKHDRKDEKTEQPVDEGRTYWAIYQSAAGECWYTINPTKRSDDFTVRRIRSRRWGLLGRYDRKLARRRTEGELASRRHYARLATGRNPRHHWTSSRSSGGRSRRRTATEQTGHIRRSSSRPASREAVSGSSGGTAAKEGSRPCERGTRDRRWRGEARATDRG